MKHVVTLGLILAGVWVLWSWHFTTLLLILGVASCIGTVLIARRMRIVDEELLPLYLPLRLPLYLPWLFLEIVKSNLDVARLILNPRMPISPRVIQVTAGQHGELGRVIYANSITLTPGTVSIDTAGDTITVHALTEEAAEGVLAGEMDRRVSRLEGPA